MSFRYVPGAWDTDIKALVKAQGWEDDERHVGAAALKLLLVNASEHANDDAGGAFWPSISTIAHETSLDDRTVKAGLAKLMRLGLIAETRPSTQHFPTIYQLLVQRAGDAPRGGETPSLPPGVAVGQDEPGVASRPVRGGEPPSRGGEVTARGGEPPPDPEGSRIDPESIPNLESAQVPKKVTKTLTPDFIASMNAKYLSDFGSVEAIAEIIQDAVNHQAYGKRSDKQRYVDGWLRRDADKVKQNGGSHASTQRSPAGNQYRDAINFSPARR